MTERSTPSRSLEAGSLTGSQEKLLARFCDNECGAIGRMRAERLCGRNEEARLYVDLLRSMKEEIPAYTAAFPEPSENLWDRVLAGIEHQERLDLIDMENRDSRLLDTLKLGFGRLSYGIVAGCATAALIFTVGRSPAFRDRKVSTARMAAITGHESASNQKIQPVQLASDGNYDYFHSKGRVKVQRPSQRSTIFWIRKKDIVDIKPDLNKGQVFYLDPRLANDPLLQGD